MIRNYNRNLMERRRAELERVDDMLTKPTILSGRLLAMGAGEIQVEMKFPVLFSEVPILSFAGELDDNETAVTGRFPTATGTVHRWLRYKEDQQGGFDGYYVGAVVGLVTTGQESQRLWVHWTAIGQALRNPVNQAASVEAVI